MSPAPPFSTQSRLATTVAGTLILPRLARRALNQRLLPTR